MDNYRLYLLDDTGHIVRAHPIPASDDEVARKQASQMAANESWELWFGTRIVDRFIGRGFQKRMHHH